MPNKRDNFTEATINKAAARVGYRCSHPNCSNATIGASMENKNKVSKTGVGAHICAAAENGPRYDSTMTTEERRSVDNCIWLCQTHAKLIDTDVTTFTVELLHQWKDAAEKQASIALADISFFDNYYNANGENLCVVEELLDGLISDGSYDKVSILLNQYKNNLSEHYNEFILRYKIIFDAYCNRSELSHDLSNYIKISTKNGINKIIELFIALSLKEELKKVFEFCSEEELKKISTLIIDEQFFSSLVCSSTDSKTLTYSKETFKTVEKALANYAFQQDLYNLKDQDGNYINLYDGEFFYEIKSLIFNMTKKLIFGQEVSTSEIEYIKDKIPKLNLLDIVLQTEIISHLLKVLLNFPQDYMTVYSSCDSRVKQEPKIQEAHYIFLIENEIDSIDIDELLSFSAQNNNYFCLQLFLSKKSPEYELRFLDEHAFLFEKDSFFIYRKYILFDSKKTEEITNIFNRYSQTHSNDFLFNCMRILLSDNDDDRTTTFDWLSHNTALIMDRDLDIYINILYKYEQWNQLYELSKKVFHNPINYKIALHLHSSKIPEYISRSQEIYLELIESSYIEKGLFYNCGIIQFEKGEIENAKKNVQKEYDLYKEEYSLISLLNMRYTTNDFKDDFYLLEAKKITNPQLQHLAGVTLEKLNKHEEARNHLLRSLLIDDNNPYCINGLYSICSQFNDNKSSLSNENTICKISNNAECLNIAIHSPDVIENITPNKFAGCTHISSENPEAASLMFAIKGDTIEIFGKQYVLDEIVPINTFLSRHAFSSIINSPDTIKICGNSTEDAIAQITKYMKQSSEESKKIIDDYNKLPIKYCLSSFSKIINKSMLESCEFLAYGNTEKIQNNPCNLDIDLSNCTFILSYDSIIHLSILGLADTLLKQTKCLASPTVIQQISSDILNETSSITNGNHTGVMVYNEGRIGIIEHDQKSRSERYQYLIKLKNFSIQIPQGNDFDYHIDTEYLKDFWNKEKMYCEKSSLALAKKIKNSVLLTDDQFLYSIANLEQIPCIGLCSLINIISNDFTSLITNVKKLSKLNFSVYFNLETYQKSLDFIKNDTQNSTNEETLTNFLYSENEDVPASDHHRKLVIDVYKNFIAKNPEQIKTKTLLGEMAIMHFGKLYPEELNRIIHNSLKNIKIEVDVTNNFD